MLRSLPGKLSSTLAGLRRSLVTIALLALIVGLGMALYEHQTSQGVSALGVRPTQMIDVTTHLRANHSITFGPIAAPKDSWINVKASSNESAVMRITSNATGAIFNSTGILFIKTVPVHDSADYNVTLNNPTLSTAFVKGNVTLADFAITDVTVQKTTHPLLLPGLGILSMGAIILFYISLPRDPVNRRFLDV